MKRAIKNLLCLVVAMALFCSGFFCQADEQASDSIDQIIASMSLRDKLAQMIFFSPRAWKADYSTEDAAENVTVLNDATRQYISEHRFGGFLLFSENCADAEQVLRLTADLKATALAGGGVMPLIAADQEGGNVARLGFGTTGVGNMALAATGDPECARKMAGVYGEELSLLGIDVDFAPVMDVNDNAANPVIGVRSFGDDARIVSEYGLAYMDGLCDAGTVACVKHFPGHGNTDTDSHTGLPLVNRTLDELMANELIPFKAAIDAGADMVMTAHIQFPQIETQTYTSTSSGEEIFIPATMSKTILTDILREKLGFDGVIVSDALDMQAISDNFTPDDMLALCVNAGVNMLIFPSVVKEDIWTIGDDLLNRAVALTEQGVIDIDRVNDSVRRILLLKQKCGLLDAASADITEEQVTAAVEGCGSAQHRQIAWDIAEKALTLLKSENDAFPMKVKAGEKTLILFTAASRAGAGDLSRQILKDMGALPEGASIESMVIEPDTAEDCVAAAKEADHVLLVSRAWAADCLDPATENGFPVGVVNRIIGDLHAAGKTAVVISAQLPYDAACYPEADAILLTYVSSAMRSAPNATGAGSAYAPNLPAAICAAFGAAETGGTLPVNLPALDDQYHLTDEILYPRRAADADDEEPQSEGRLSASAIPSVPDGGWQREAVFPDWKGYVDDTLAMNSMVSFDGWHGQGYFYMSLDENVDSLRLFVNGCEIDTSSLRGGESCRVDFSSAAKDGKNTIQVTQISPNDLQEAVKVYIPYPVILDGSVEESGIAPDALELIDDLISADVARGFPGAQLAIVRHGRLVYENAWGKANACLPDGTPIEAGAPVTAETMYDLASVTKMFATNYALQKLLTEGKFSLDDAVSMYLGDRFFQDVIDVEYQDGANPGIETQRAWKADITVRDLLCHQAGFPPAIDYYNPYYNVSALKYDPDAENVLYSGVDGSAETKAATVEAMCKTPLLYEPRTATKYSDIDYMLLGVIVESLTGTDLDSYLKQSFLEPMGLTRVSFNPLDNGFSAEDCAATELNGNTRNGAVDFPGIRTQTLQGQVHDEKAWYCMGGVSGHAGLFGSASDIAKLAGVMLTGGWGETRFFSRNVTDLFTAPKSADFGQWGLGWWRNGDAQRPWYFGTEAGSAVVGHQGWTGTLVMIDPEHDLAIAYLTNKINSPVTDGEANPNKFDGNWFTASTLGFVPQILSIGLDADTDILPQLRSLTADMVNESQKLIPENASPDHPAARNADGKAAVAEKWAEDCALPDAA